ncbi:MAG: hypothetical protein AAF653_15175, partial [Chloroflexota bacterium]
MKIINQFVLTVVCVICAGCDGAVALPSPTAAPTFTPQQIATQPPTRTPRPVDVSPVFTLTPSRTPIPTVTALPTETPLPLDFTPAPVPDAEATVIGQSVGGRDIVVR